MSNQAVKQLLILAAALGTAAIWLAIYAFLLVDQLEETRKQRDEAYELAHKAQQSAMYWYDVHEKMVWHTQPTEETK